MDTNIVPSINVKIIFHYFGIFYSLPLIFLKRTILDWERSLIVIFNRSNCSNKVTFIILICHESGKYLKMCYYSVVNRWQSWSKQYKMRRGDKDRRRRGLKIITTVVAEEEGWQKASSGDQCGCWRKSYAAGKQTGPIRHFSTTYPTFDNMEKQLHLNLLASRPPSAGGFQCGSKMKMGWELASWQLTGVARLSAYKNPPAASAYFFLSLHSVFIITEMFGDAALPHMFWMTTDQIQNLNVILG